MSSLSASSGVVDSQSDESLLYASPGGGVSAAAAAAALPPSITDPSTADGSSLVFSREIPLEVRHSDDHDSTLGTLLTVTVKVLVLYSEQGTAESVRIELSRENDLFFSMYHTLQEKGFLAMQARQKLMVEFCDYPQMLVTNFTKCIKDPHNCMNVLYVHRDGSGRMDFIQNVGFKFVELLSVDFLLTPSDVIKEHIIFRYFSVRKQVDMLQARLHDVNELVKNKSPSLLLAIKKTPLRSSAQPSQAQQQLQQQQQGAAASSSSSSHGHGHHHSLSVGSGGAVYAPFSTKRIR